MDKSDSPATRRRKAKLMFGLKKKKKKKVNTDLVLAHKGAVDSEVEVPPEESLLLEGENTEEPGSSEVKTRIRPNYKRAKLKTCIQKSEGKPQSFQIAINITEGRQLVGENIDPSVVIEIGDEKKQTSVKEGTNAPFYNEYFVFDFFAHKEIFFDKVIKLTVMHSKMLRSFCVGSFKLDVWTVYKQPGHQFINKWAMLTNPGDISTGVKGYVKCDISVSAKGDAMQPGQKAHDAEEQIDKNLLIPEGFPSERPWARFYVKVYRAEGLPRNNSSIMANVTKAFIGDNTALIDPYVVVSFFKNMGRTSTQRSTADPVWNEQIVFTEMFPPLCQRLKIQVWDEGSMSDVAIGTHYFDLRRISNEQDGDKGFLPTFGPAWINLYGSNRNYSIGDDTAELNEGIGEGVSYRGRVYMELTVEILSGGMGSESKLSRMAKPLKDIKAGKGGGKDGKTPAGGGAGAAAGGAADDDKGKAVAAEVLPVEAPSVPNPDNNESFLLFGALFEATMIDRKIGDKPIIFEFSMGNYGNTLESVGQPSAPVPSPHVRRRKALDIPESVDLFVPSSPRTSPTSPSSPLLPRESTEREFPSIPSTSKSTTPPLRPVIVEGNKYFMYLPLQKQKPCINVLSHWENRTYRLYNSNMLEDIAHLFEEGVASAAELHRKSDPSAAKVLKTTLKEFCMDARSFITAADAKLKAELKSNYLTQLDRKRLTMCKQELESMIGEAQSLGKRKRKTGGVKEMLQEATKLTQKLRFLVEEPQHTVPDVFVWLLSNNKRIAYARVRARDVLFSSSQEARGIHCGKILTLFLKPPGKRGAGLSVQAKVDVYLWYGTCLDSIYMLDDLPAGFSPAIGGADASCPPTALLCTEQHQFQLRCHMYQARGLIAADTSGLSDPFARVTYLSNSQTTNIISQTLSPTWNQCLPMSRLMVTGDLLYIQEEPPRILIEVYDDDTLGKAEYLGTTVAVPEVRLSSDPYTPPTLQYSPLHCGSQSGGDLLAAFELLEIPESGEQSLPALEEREGGIYAVPANIRPVLSTYRLEVLFWGLRELKKVQFLSVDRPQVFIECAGKTLRSSVIQKYKSNPNFTMLVDIMELELPENELLHPPLSITVVDWRAFGRSTLVGNHIINNLKAFKYTPPPAPPAPVQIHEPPTVTLTTRPAATPEPQSAEGPSQEAAETSSTTGLTNQDFLITVEEEPPPAPAPPPPPSPPPPPPAPPSPKPESRKKRMKDSSAKSTRGRSTKRRRRTIADESAECVIDWWSKYYASVEKQAKQKDGSPFPQIFEKEASPYQGLLSDGIDSLVGSFSDGDKKRKTQKGRGTLEPSLGLPTKLATLKLFNKELEAEFGPFDDWVNTYELFRGKANEEEGATEERFVGKFKGKFCLYKLIDDEPEDWDEATDTGDFRVSRGIPSNNPVQVLIRVYVVSASNLHPADPDGKADPYIVIRLGKNEIKDRDNYIPKQLNPVFGRSFEIHAKFPQESLLTVVIYDHDMVGGDDLIGETRIDLENRFYSRHRATCGLPTEYSIDGYNAWRDCLKPSELLTKLCRENDLSDPQFRPGRITVAGKVFTGKTLFIHEDEPLESYEHLSLKILHRWAEIPVVGCKLVPEHIETRTLFNKARPGMDQVFVLTLSARVHCSPSAIPDKIKTFLQTLLSDNRKYELRMIIWNTEDVILEDTSFLTGQQSSDIYVKGWLKGLEDDRQETDVHHNSLTGEGNFNWRFVFPFHYLPAEKVVVVRKKEHIFSLEKTEQKIPAILILQVWDFETLSSDDFLGTLELNLHGFPRGAKTAKSCKTEMLTDGTERISIFQQKRARGWWPFSKSGELTGKVEAEFHLVTAEEAEKNPVGKARKEPEPLPKPNRPDTSFSWFVNPFKCFFHLVWRSYKKYIIIALVLLISVLFLFLLFYTLPGAISQKIVSG
ncbi:fer-1-like protein 6 [Plectropomus leopardus]|uniref:fer-1-like protein 6 n=1 Tax=Plectropomus leopardus TaxID=160734 RepID=UPI001C4C217B|nr:fer-1-like protein 6 [Plectropomus leopardus]